MKFVFAILFLCVAVQLSESFLFNRATSRPTQRPFSRGPWGYSGDQVAEPVVLDNIREFIQNNFLTPFVERILKPLENNFLRPLEQNIRQKLSEFQLNTLPKVKQFFKDSIVAPIDQNLGVLKEQINQYIERFGRFISKESRDQYKQKITEFIDNKLRQPLLERIQKLLKRIENELDQTPEAYEAEPVFLDTIKNFVERNIVTPFVNNVLKPIEERFIRPLEQNIRKQLSDLKLNTLPKAREFVRTKILEPVEAQLANLKSKVHDYIETFGKLISKESREHYKRQIAEFIDNKIRQPLLERIKKLSDKIENEIEDPEVYDAEPVFLDTIKDFVERNFVTPFVNNVLKPIEERFIRPLEQNIRKQLSDLQLNTIPKAKEFVKSKILEPVEAQLANLKNKVHEYIETFGKLISKESREHYKRQISEFIDTKIRLPLLERISKLTNKIENELEAPDAYDAQPVFLDTIKDFVERNFVTPFINNVLKPIEDRFIRPLEQNIRKQLSDLQLNTIPQAKKFISEKIVEPLEAQLANLKSKVHDYIETFGKLISKDSREHYKRQISEFIDTKIRLPLLERVKSITERVEKELDN